MEFVFLPRDAVHKRGICNQKVSVCPSLSGIVSKRLDLLSKSFTVW